MPSDADLSREQLLRILTSLPEVITVVDSDLRIRYVNDPEQDESTAEAIRGTPALDYVAPSRRDEQREMLRRVLETGKEQTFEVPITMGEEEIRWYEGRMSPIRRNGEIEAVLVVSRDVTARRLAEEEAEKLRELVPICSWCGNVRSDDGYWSTVESYIEEKRDARVTHGMCPECQEDVAPNGTEGG